MNALFSGERRVTVDGTEYTITADEGSGDDSHVEYFRIIETETGKSYTVLRNGREVSRDDSYNGIYSFVNQPSSIQRVLEETNEITLVE